MTRLLVLGLLLHHIEGVCKPWTAAGLAARAAVARLGHAYSAVEMFVARLGQAIRGRDHLAAVQRAQDVQDARTRRALDRQAQRPSSGLYGRVHDSMTPMVVDGEVVNVVEDVSGSIPKGITGSTPETSITEQLHRHHRGAR